MRSSHKRIRGDEVRAQDPPHPPHACATTFVTTRGLRLDFVTRPLVGTLSPRPDFTPCSGPSRSIERNALLQASGEGWSCGWNMLKNESRPGDRWPFSEMNTLQQPRVQGVSVSKSATSDNTESHSPHSARSVTMHPPSVIASAHTSHALLLPSPPQNTRIPLTNERFMEQAQLEKK